MFHCSIVIFLPSQPLTALLEYLDYKVYSIMTALLEYIYNEMHAVYICVPMFHGFVISKDS